MSSLKSIRNYLRTQSTRFARGAGSCLSGVPKTRAMHAGQALKSLLGMLVYQIRTTQGARRLRFRENFVPYLGCLNNVSKTLSVAIIALLLTACAGNAKKQVSANVESEQIEIPAEAAQQFSLAVKTMGEGKAQEAEAQFVALTQTYPQLSGPFANLGVIYAQKKEWEKAEGALQTAVQKNKKNAKAFNQLGLVYRQQGQFKKAEQAYLDAIAVDAQFADAYLNMGILADIYLGDMARAVKYYEKYQTLLGEPDRRVAGWLVDINRRLGTKSQVASGGQ